MVRHVRWIGAWTVLSLPGLTLAGQCPREFTLGRYVPADVWMYVHEIHNPERDFIHAHWERVFEAAAKCGIDEEIKKLISSKMDDAEKATFETKWDSVRDAIKAIPCSQLGMQEFALAQRIAMPMPNYLLMFRSPPADTAAAIKPLEHLLKTAGSLSDECTVVESKNGKATVWSLVIGDVGPVVKLFVRNDIIGVAVGRDIADEALALMEGADKEKKRLTDDATFKRALASVESPEDSLHYFRLTRFVEQIRDCVHFGLKKAENDADVALFRSVFFKGLAHVDFIDYVVISNKTEGLQEVASTVVKLAPDCREKPFVKALVDRKAFDRFDRFVPEDATGYFCSTMIDLSVVYDAVLDFIRTEVPNDGPAMIEQWNAMQEQWGFNPSRDVFGWLSGETVGVGLPSCSGSQVNFAMFVRTKDPVLAAEKVNAALDRLVASFPQVTINPAPEVEAEGFRSVFHPMMMMMQTKLVIGFYKEWLVIGAKPQDVNRCIAVDKGDAPSIRNVERFKKEGLIPESEVVAASFSDLTHTGEELGMMFGMMGMVGGMIPDQPETQPVRMVFSMMARLAPVVAEINFFSSSSGWTKFTGDGWIGKSVVTYKPAEIIETKIEETAEAAKVKVAPH